MTARPAVRKVVVIGLDGLEPSLAGPMIASGELPNLARLSAQGGFGKVATTSPAQTPVAWSTFAVGTNPGGHGVFDFIRRDPATYLPDLALNRYEQKSAWLPPKAVNLRQGIPFWDRLAERGIPSAVVRCPCTYPPRIDKGRMLSGMGVPDLRGGLGTPTFFSTASDLAPLESENVVRLIPNGSGDRFSASLVGPRNPKDGANLGFDLDITVDRSNQSISVRSAGSPDPLTVKQGAWSEWLRVKFKAGLLQTVRGMVRLHLVRVEPELEIHASPINFDPEQPLFPISAPGGYATELLETLGPYYTTGMVEDHTGLNNGRIDEYAFLDQCEEVWAEREAMLLHELNRTDEGFIYCLFDTSDRVQHLFWRYREPDHPANAVHGFRKEFAQVVADQYRKADEILGRALEFADDRTLFIAMSDHGFGSFRRGFHINNWLKDQGLLTLKPGGETEAHGPGFPSNVDWSRTKAYALGLGGIYLNLKGREGRGIVAPDEAEGLKAAIARGLTGLVDPVPGTVAVREVLTREQVYSGPFIADSPDLVVHLAAGCRISWDSSLGGVAPGEAHFEDNTKRWSGDHIIDPKLVPGMLAMNRPFAAEGARLTDLAPTILDALGVETNAHQEGSTLLR